MAEESNKRRKVVERREVIISVPAVHAPGWLQGFVDFIREQGVVGLAVGLILGVAAKSLIDSFVNNLINPIIGLVTGGVTLEHKTLCLKHAAGACSTPLDYGQFFSDLISFLIVAVVVYFVVKGLKLDKLDKKKDA